MLKIFIKIIWFYMIPFKRTIRTLLTKHSKNLWILPTVASTIDVTTQIDNEPNSRDFVSTRFCYSLSWTMCHCGKLPTTFQSFCKMSALNLSVKVHPIVLFQIVDAFERRNADSQRVIGTLLGGEFILCNCFPAFNIFKK